MNQKTPKAQRPAAELSESRDSKRETGSGKYVLDRALGRLVKVSDRASSRTSAGAGEDSDAGPCGRSECGGGSCAMDD